MEKLINLITNQMTEAFEKAGYDGKYAKVTLSNRPDLCEFQCNGAMAAAKEYKKAPFMIADAVVANLEGNEMFAMAESVKPGFINLKVSEKFLADYANQMDADADLGVTKEGNGKTIVIDYGGANVAKPLHVGHLRSAVIGECVKRICNFMGYKAIGDVHLGDWGLQMGLIIVELKCRKPELCYFDESYTGEYPAEAPFTISELEDIYPTASKKSKEDEEFKAAAHEATLKLQSGYAPYTAIWKHIMAVSVADLKKNYGNLNVSFELWKGESDAQEFIPGLIADLEERGLAYESEGALVVDVKEETDKKEIPPCIVRKSDGAALYATSDLGTIIQRERDYKPVQYIYVTDKRQEMHFVQVFRTAKKAGYVGAETPMTHIGFGTMNGPDGKPFKTRDGGVMRLEYLIADIQKAVYERMLENREMEETEARETSKMIALSALKYGDLSNQPSKDYIFDIDRFISFEGNTGPYILYTIVRMKSILKKYAESGKSAEGKGILPAASEEAKNLMLVLSRFGTVMENVFAEMAPQKLCAYIYELSNEFNRFYHSTRILAEEDETVQAGYIKLLSLTKKVLEQSIDVLGFEAPEQM